MISSKQSKQKETKTNRQGSGKGAEGVNGQQGQGITWNAAENLGVRGQVTALFSTSVAGTCRCENWSFSSSSLETLLYNAGPALLFFSQAQLGAQIHFKPSVHGSIPCMYKC